MSVVGAPLGVTTTNSIATAGAARLVGTPAAPSALSDLLVRPGTGVVCLALSRDPNGKVTLLLFPREGPTVVAKVPTTERAARQVQREADNLERLGQWPLDDTIPRPLGMASHQGRPVLLTSAAPGVPMLRRYHGWRHTARSASVAADFSAAAHWLADFQRRTAADVAELDMSAGVERRLLARFGTDPELPEDLTRLERCSRELGRARARRTAVHGDFWFGNLLVQPRRAGYGPGPIRPVAGVVDWEMFRACDAPTHDLARFVLSYSLYLDRHRSWRNAVSGHPGIRRSRPGDGIRAVFEDDGWYPSLARGFLREGLRRIGVDGDLWRSVLLAGLAGIAAEADHMDFARTHLELFRLLSRRCGA